MLASQIEETLERETASPSLNTPAAGRFLQERLFKPGNRMNWADLVQHVAGQPLNPEAWLRQFATSKVLR